jgi:O-antigen ligase
MIFIFKSKKLNKIEKFISFLFIITPLLLITGPFLSDLAVVICSIYYIFNIKKINLLKDYHFLIGLFIIFYLVVLFNSFRFEYYMESIKSFTFYFRFLLFTLVISHLISKERKIIDDFFNIGLTAIFLVFLTGFIEFIFIRYDYLQNLVQFYDKREALLATPYRIGGLFGDEKIMGGYISKIFPVVFGSFFIKFSYKNDNKNKFILAIFGFISFFTIIISGDRAPLVIFIFTLFLIFCFVTNLRKLILVSGVVTLLLGSTLIFLDPIIKERTINQTYRSISGGYNDNKLTLISKSYEGHYKAALIIFNEYPYFGSGIKGFRNQCFDNHIDKGGVICTTHPHNTYFQFLSETGLFGFVILVGLFFYLFYKIICIYLINRKNISEYYGDAKIIFLIHIFMFIWPLTTSGSFFNNYNSIFYTLPIILLLSANRIKKN